MRGDMEEFRAVTRDPLNAAAWHRKVVVHAPAMGTTATANNYRLYPVTIHAKRGRTRSLDGPEAWCQLTPERLRSLCNYPWIRQVNR